jgi:hypothetical protein
MPAPLIALAFVTQLSLAAPDPASLGVTRTTARTTATRPLSVVFDGSTSGPTGAYGLTVGYHLDEDFELSVGGGLGLTGIQVAFLARYTIPLGDSPTMSWVFGAGPSFGFRSEDLGLHIEQATDDTVIDPSKLYYTLWLNAELGWMGRATWGGTLRFVLGVGVRLADNQRRLCDGAPETGGDCNPPHFGPGSLIANAPVLPYLSMAFGWAF